MFVKDLEMNDSYLEQRVNIQPSVKLEKYANKTFNMFKDFYNDKEVSRTKLFDKYKKFRQSRKDELDDWWINYLTNDKTNIGILVCSNGLLSLRLIRIRMMARWLHFDKGTTLFRSKIYTETIISPKKVL